MIPSNKGLTCPGHPFHLTAYSVREDGKLDDWRGWGEEDGIEPLLILPAGIEKYLHLFRGSVLRMRESTNSAGIEHGQYDAAA